MSYYANLSGDAGLHDLDKDYNLSYKGDNLEGFSGAPLIGYYDDNPVIVGIHKGKDEKKQKGMGVSAHQMI